MLKRDRGKGWAEKEKKGIEEKGGLKRRKEAIIRSLLHDVALSLKILRATLFLLF